jgi:predicted ABC-type ATPase
LESVISSPDKVQLLEQARQLGYRTYLNFIATDDPAINISRVQNRVKQGGAFCSGRQDRQSLPPLTGVVA